MNKEDKIMFYGTIIIIIITGVVVGIGFAYKDAKIEKITKENNKLKQEIKDYKWQIEQVPYVIESWCKGE